MAGDWLVALIGALFGALFGSFLNVCIVRLPKDESVVSPRSRCPRCGAQLAWYDNIPVVSWLVLRGKCRGCQLPISALYPVVELLVMALWGWMAWRHGFGLEGLRGAVFGTILIGIAFTDAREYIIPNEFTIGGLVIGLLFAAAGGLADFQVAALGAAVGFALLWLVGAAGTWAFKEEAMGGGDIKMMAMVGAFVGWQGVLLTVFLGALLGTLVFLPLMLLGRKKLVPFGVFLALGGVAAHLFGPAIFAWYGTVPGAGLTAPGLALARRLRACAARFTARDWLKRHTPLGRRSTDIGLFAPGAMHVTEEKVAQAMPGGAPESS